MASSRSSSRSPKTSVRLARRVTPRAAGKPVQKPKLALALAGGGPLGAMYEVGVLMALDEAIDGLDLNDMDIYVGVSAGSFITAGLANGMTPAEIYRLFIDNENAAGQQGALKPEIFLRPAIREYWQRGRSIPVLAAGGLLRWLARPLKTSPAEAFASLSRAIPAGVFDNEAISRFLTDTFSHAGRSNDFRRLKHQLYSVAVDLDTGKAVTFGATGFDHIPIAKAVQASAALPGLFPPVEIDGHHYVDGALKKTLNASLALEDGAELVLCVNPLVPFDADAAGRRAGANRRDMQKLIEGGLPAVLSQTFRTMIHSRMHVGLEKYASKYARASIVLFEPAGDDAQMFFTNLFSYATRKQVCEHAYQRTRADLLKRRHELAPIFEKFGMQLNLDVLNDQSRTLDRRVFKRGAALPLGQRLAETHAALSDTLRELDGLLARRRAMKISSARR